MATERRLPQPVTYIQDFGLNVTPTPAQRNKRVVLLGTADDGPMYEPIQFNKPEDAELVFGRNGAGDLVRGIFECWDVQTGNPTVVGVRIGNGKRAVLSIPESNGSGRETAQAESTVALKLQAKYPGQIYNQISIGYNDNREVAIYNPKTGLTSSFSVDTESALNPNVDAHNVSELVNAINADANLSTVLDASYEPIIADYELAISGLSLGVNAQANKVTIDLGKAVSYVTNTGFIISSPLNANVTATNNLVALDTIEAVSISEWNTLECRGKTSNELALSPLDGKGTASWDTIQAMKDYDSDNQFLHDPSGNIVSEYIYSLENEFIDITDAGTPSGGMPFYNGITSNTLKLTIPLCLDDSEMSGQFDSIMTNVASGIITTDSNYSNYAVNFINATCQGIATKVVGTQNVRPSGVFKMYVSETADPNNFWQELPYDSSSGIYLSGWLAAGSTDPYGNGVEKLDKSTAIFGVGAYAANNPIMRSLVDASGVIMQGKYVRITGNTIKGFLGEVENLNSLYPATLPSNPTVTSYFVRGQEILFNTPPSFNMVFNYGTRITYEVGSTVSLDDAANGVISFATEGLLPGPGGATIANDKISYLRFRYSFQPTWPAITSAASSLSGGTNGNVLNGNQRKAEFKKAYDRLKNYGASLWVPMGAFIDSTAIRYNPITGLREEISAGYHEDLEEFMEDLSINNIQPHVILGVNPMLNTSLEEKDKWVKRLTETNVNDSSRGANVMQQIQSKFMSVCAFEPIFLNIGRGRPYTANGQAAYAGFIASLPHNISPTNKSVTGINDIRFDLSISQYEALNDARYIGMKSRGNGAPIIVEDKTAAPLGSDFVNWVIYSITAEAADRVRRIAESFIGRPNSIEVRASLEQLIANELMSMEGLRAYDFSSTSTPNQQVLGIIEIDLILVPIFTIKKIRTTVKLRKNLPAT